MTDYITVPVETDSAMWKAAEPHLKDMVKCGVANATDFDNAYQAAIAAAPQPADVDFRSTENLIADLRERLEGDTLVLERDRMLVEAAAVELERLIAPKPDGETCRHKWKPRGGNRLLYHCKRCDRVITAWEYIEMLEARVNG